jgi:hypothetical protein
VAAGGITIHNLLTSAVSMLDCCSPVHWHVLPFTVGMVVGNGVGAGVGGPDGTDVAKSVGK